MKARKHVIAFTCAIAGAASAHCCAAPEICKGRDSEPGTIPFRPVLEVDVTAVQRGYGISPADLLYVRAKQSTALPAADEKVQLAFDRAPDGGHDLAGEAKDAG